MNELKPCPFCGGKAQLRDGHIYMAETVIAECTKCHVRLLPVFIDHPEMTVGGVDESTRYTKEQAFQVAQRNWNRRARNENTGRN